MTNIIILTEQEINDRLASMKEWKYENSKISKEFQFKDFMDSLNFINAIAPYCESQDHHPDIHIFYNKVLFELQRFDVGGKVTDKDFLVAEEIERLYANKQA